MQHVIHVLTRLAGNGVQRFGLRDRECIEWRASELAQQPFDGILRTLRHACVLEGSMRKKNARCCCLSFSIHDSRIFRCFGVPVRKNLRHNAHRILTLTFPLQIIIEMDNKTSTDDRSQASSTAAGFVPSPVCRLPPGVVDTSVFPGKLRGVIWVHLCVAVQYVNSTCKKRLNPRTTERRQDRQYLGM